MSFIITNRFIDKSACARACEYELPSVALINFHFVVTHENI